MDEGWVGRNATGFLPCRKLLKTVGFEGVRQPADDSSLEEILSYAAEVEGSLRGFDMRF